MNNSKSQELIAKYKQVLKKDISLDELGHQYPFEWKQASEKVLSVIGQKSPERINSLLATSLAEFQLIQKRMTTANSVNHLSLCVSRSIYLRLTILAIQEFSIAHATKSSQGSLKLSILNGLVLQSIFFKKGLERKIVSYPLYKFFWKYISQKEVFMTLIQPKGLYCFYAKPLLAKLVKIIESSSCLEVAAGDGLLGLSLQKKGLSIRITDDYSWADRVVIPSQVENLSAADALNKYHPRVVICSWPPADNTFEKEIFSSPHTQLYIVLGSKNIGATGNSTTYKRQKDFSCILDEHLSSYLLPHEINGGVWLFKRRPTTQI